MNGLLDSDDMTDQFITESDSALTRTPVRQLVKLSSSELSDNAISASFLDYSKADLYQDTIYSGSYVISQMYGSPPGFAKRMRQARESFDSLPALRRRSPNVYPLGTTGSAKGHNRATFLTCKLQQSKGENSGGSMLVTLQQASSRCMCGLNGTSRVEHSTLPRLQRRPPPSSPE